MHEFSIRTNEDSTAAYENLLIMPDQDIQDSIKDHRSIYNTHESFYYIIDSYSLIMFLNGLRKENVDQEKYIKEHPFTRQLHEFYKYLEQGRKHNVVTSLRINRMEEWVDLKKFQISGILEQHFEYVKWLSKILNQSVMIQKYK